MSRRSSRARKSRSAPNVSSAWYVGYAEDNESVEAIMKKFEELDRLQMEVQREQQTQLQVQPTQKKPRSKRKTPTEVVSEHPSSSQPRESAAQEIEPILSQQQLEELFKRTSVFSLQSALTSNPFEDEEVWLQNHPQDDTNSVEEEPNDYQVVDDDVWDSDIARERPPPEPSRSPSPSPPLSIGLSLSPAPLSATQEQPSSAPSRDTAQAASMGAPMDSFRDITEAILADSEPVALFGVQFEDFSDYQLNIPLDTEFGRLCSAYPPSTAMEMRTLSPTGRDLPSAMDLSLFDCASPLESIEADDPPSIVITRTTIDTKALPAERLSPRQQFDSLSGSDRSLHLLQAVEPLPPSPQSFVAQDVPSELIRGKDPTPSGSKKRKREVNRISKSRATQRVDTASKPSSQPESPAMAQRPMSRPEPGAKSLSTIQTQVAESESIPTLTLSVTRPTAQTTAATLASAKPSLKPGPTHVTSCTSYGPCLLADAVPPTPPPVSQPAAPISVCVDLASPVSLPPSSESTGGPPSPVDIITIAELALPPKPKEKKTIDREIMINRYRSLANEIQERTATVYIAKKPPPTIDPTLPTYIRIPAAPVSRAWLKTIEPFEHSQQPLCRSRHLEADILNMDLKSLGNSFQAVHMDPPLTLKRGGEKGKVTPEQLCSIDIPSIIKVGFIFVWVEKEFTPVILRICQSWGFRYVENFAWIKKYVNNKIARQPYKYFCKSKTTCLIFRKEGEIEMRHQRNPDCEFDFIKPETPGDPREQKPPYIYTVIETLLPEASRGDGDKLLELWSRDGFSREGWTTVTDIAYAETLT
ncbi:uncharacterized protein BJ171DRAFT_568837 [Polychytrium aggregatum]|uniref:uncharacterized protein n=1 Tax=Polychytrium aggregatum TaxID=110093 RepID=UPI0022FE499D|nr:uncharacterized protein BJ171DRAFT_568837 [Polychytrium aggregatum]KAI9203741.1 hypothetical protein BJ171DRAFT_568837 [Polychytrium aggregatum]